MMPTACQWSALRRLLGMAMYYDGDTKADLERYRQNLPTDLLDDLDLLGKQNGYGYLQQVLQALWARHLESKGLPKSGALFR